MTNHELNMVRLQVIEVELLRLHARKKVVDEQVAHPQVSPSLSKCFQSVLMSRYEQARLNYEIAELEHELTVIQNSC